MPPRAVTNFATGGVTGCSTFDRKNQGFLIAKEFSNMSKILGEPFTEAELADFKAAAGGDAGGKIEWQPLAKKMSGQ